MKGPLYITASGAVTPAGLTARQTIAAVRASLSAYQTVTLSTPFGKPQLMSRLEVHEGLRTSEGDWLVNMAVRALDETLTASQVSPQRTALLLALPEGFREHPAFQDTPPTAFLRTVTAELGNPLHPMSRAIDGGAAASVGMLQQVADILDHGDVEQVILGGVDSLLNDRDLARLADANRLKDDENAQGFVPGEGAAFVAIQAKRSARTPALAAILGVGIAQERDTVLTERHSQGNAMLRALSDAVSGQGPKEPDIGFIISNGNGERYVAWEASICRPRFYRTHREILPTAYPAMTVGDIGCASGALALMLAADSFARNYAPGRVAMLEIASESGLRAAAVVAAMRRG